MKTIWKKHKLAIIIIGYLVAFVSIVYFLAIPLINSLKKSSDNIQKSMADQQLAQARLDKLPQMESDWIFFESNKDSLDILLGSENQIEFIKSIDSIAEKTGNEINLSIGEAVGEGDYEKAKKPSQKKTEGKESILDEISYKNYVQAEINLKGSYNGLVNFIHMLENNKFYVNIISIDIKKQEKKEEEIAPNVKNNVFEAGSQEKIKTENEKKEILNSLIKIIVYTKK